MLVLLLILSLSSSTAPDVDSKEFAQILSTNQNVHVMFYAPWCGHCKNFKPIFDSVADEIRHTKKNAKLVKVDCTQHDNLCQQHKVQGYPTIQHFHNAQFEQNYEGHRTFEGYLGFVLETAHEPLKEITLVSEYESLPTDTTIAFGFFCESLGILQQFKEAAESVLRSVADFYYTTSKQVCDQAKFHDNVVLLGLEDSPLVHPQQQDLQEWIKSSYLGPCGKRNHKTEKLFGGTVLMAYFPVDQKYNQKYTEYYIKRMRRAMGNYSGQFMCGYSNIDDHAKKLGLEGENIAVFMFSGEHKYKMTDKFSVDSVVGFVEQFLDGGLKPHLKSQPVPESNLVPGITELVGLNFEEVVGNSKHAFILFHAPWCGHCKSVMPVFEQLGMKLANDNSIVVGRIDATNNEFPQMFEVRGFPMFYLVTEGKVLKYEGGRTLEGFLAFLKEHCGSLDYDEL